MTATPHRVRYDDDEPNGLAAMMGGLIQANLAAHPERVGLLSRRATVGIRARDIDVAASIRLGDGIVRVRNGLVARLDVRVETDSEGLAGLSSVPLRFGLPDATTPAGREVIRNLLRGTLKVRGLFVHPARLARLNRLLSVA